MSWQEANLRRFERDTMYKFHAWTMAKMWVAWQEQNVGVMGMLRKNSPWYEAVRREYERAVQDLREYRHDLHRFLQEDSSRAVSQRLRDRIRQALY